MDPRTAKALRAIAAALKSEKNSDAVRLLIDALQHRHIPQKQPNLAGWLAKNLGMRPAGHLFKALAQYPCFYCENGLSACDACEPRGATPCGNCLNIRQTRCDFCDGAGWVTYNVVPKTLWLPMLVERTTLGAIQLKKQLAASIPEPTAQNAAALTEEIQQELLLMNRLAGIFENALTASQKLKPSSPKEKAAIAAIMKRSIKAWRLIEPRMRVILKTLGETLRLQAEASERPAAARRLSAAAANCEAAAADRDFEQSALLHPFLAAAK